MDNLQMEKCVGKQIQNIQRVYCPKCFENEGFKQPLCAVGEFENELFCPHCELGIVIKISCVY